MKPATEPAAAQGRIACGRAAIAVLCAFAGSSFAQAWPTKPIRIVVPYAAGGPLDDVARVDEIARMLGGVRITATTRQHADELLRHAREDAAAG